MNKLKRSTFIASVLGFVGIARAQEACVAASSDPDFCDKERLRRLGILSTHADRKREYEICQKRGHSGTIPASTASSQSSWGWGGGSEYPSRSYPAQPIQSYLHHNETDWLTCFYCGTRYRFVTNIEEQNKPI